MDYQSKVGYSLVFRRKELTYFSIATIAFIALLIIFMPSPINYFLSLVVLIIALIFFGISFLLMKTILGIVTKIEGKNVMIYKSESFSLNPKNNEIMFSVSKNFHASLNITKDNISSVRIIKDSEEIKNIKNIDNVYRISGKSIPFIGKINHLLNKSDMEKIAFISDYTNIVEIQVKNLRVVYPGSTSFIGVPVVDVTRLKSEILKNKKSYELKNAKIMVSVKDPDEFINYLKK